MKSVKYPTKRRSHEHCVKCGEITAKKLRDTYESRFWAKVDKGLPDECWNWTGYKMKGYGKFGAINKETASHRIAWQLSNGIIPDGLYCCHKCDNRACCNPSHLFLGTHQENMDDRDRKHRTCSGEKIHFFGKYGTKSILHKLTESQVIEIRRRYALGGCTQRQLGKEYGVTKTNIYQIIYRRTWPHV